MSKLSEDFDKEKTIFVQRKDCEIEELKKHLSNKEAELSKQELQTQAHKQVLDQITNGKEALKVCPLDFEIKYFCQNFASLERH